MPKVFRSIARLIYYSNGGFTYSELYQDMPVYVRRFMIGEIEDIKKKEQEALEGDSSPGSSQGPPEDIGKAMEKMEKQSGEDIDADLEEVFGPKEERGTPDRTRAEEREQTPPSQRKPLHEENQQEQQSEPAKAEDLEQMLDKLESDI